MLLEPAGPVCKGREKALSAHWGGDIYKDPGQGFRAQPAVSPGC